ncbi:uncharacterized protein LOC106656622 [Trichogramma pretiosum]|uniref:uncharacterized protein LOC106656622 n=1 Tax=Trichogramma pretiosum TaxID=7493 RepID=UPI0006C99234|nr:uncharacterized protein LOC106656622 [Trichogramma pretiosum]
MTFLSTSWVDTNIKYMLQMHYLVKAHSWLKETNDKHLDVILEHGLCADAAGKKYIDKELRRQLLRGYFESVGGLQSFKDLAPCLINGPLCTVAYLKKTKNDGTPESAKASTLDWLMTAKQKNPHSKFNQIPCIYICENELSLKSKEASDSLRCFTSKTQLSQNIADCIWNLYEVLDSYIVINESDLTVKEAETTPALVKEKICPTIGVIRQQLITYVSSHRQKVMSASSSNSKSTKHKSRSRHDSKDKSATRSKRKRSTSSSGNLTSSESSPEISASIIDKVTMGLYDSMNKTYHRVLDRLRRDIDEDLIAELHKKAIAFSEAVGIVLEECRNAGVEDQNKKRRLPSCSEQGPIEVCGACTLKYGGCPR